MVCGAQFVLVVQAACQSLSNPPPPPHNQKNPVHASLKELCIRHPGCTMLIIWHKNQFFEKNIKKYVYYIHI